MLKKIIVNCGSSEVSAAVLDRKDGKIVLEAFHSVPIAPHPNKPEKRLENLAESIKAVVSSMGKYNRKAAYLILSGADLLTKSTKIPSTDSKKREQMIALEAQQQIPYPLDEITWDKLVVSDDGVEIEAIFIAAKSQFINELCGEVSKKGIEILGITAGPPLDYSTYKLINPEASEKALLVDIGARSSNFTFANQNEFTLRNITLGGDNLTQTLADQTGMSVEEAEELKLRIFKNEEDLNPEQKEAFEKASKAFVQRVDREISRSIANYRQKSGASPERIFLDGGVSMMPGLKEALSQSHKIPVEHFSPLMAAVPGSSFENEDLDFKKHHLTKIIGYFSKFTQGETVVNLLPNELLRSIQFKKKKLFISLTAACLVLATIPPIVYYEINIRNLEYQKSVLSSRVNRYRSLKRQTESFKEQALKVKASTEKLNGFIQSRSNWTLFLIDLQQRLEEVQDVWLDSLSPTMEARRSGLKIGTNSTPQGLKSLTIDGHMLIRSSGSRDARANNKVAADRIKKLTKALEASPFIDKIIDPYFDRSDSRVLEFRFTVTLNKKKPL